MFKLIVDNGKPFEVTDLTAVELVKELRKYYDLSLNDEDFSAVDVKVFNENDEDISESQFIEEIIGEILENEENISICLECKKEFYLDKDIWLCDDCINKFDLDKLWKLHDLNKINALDFNENKKIRERFRK